MILGSIKVKKEFTKMIIRWQLRVIKPNIMSKYTKKMSGFGNLKAFSMIL